MSVLFGAMMKRIFFISLFFLGCATSNPSSEMGIGTSTAPSESGASTQTNSAPAAPAPKEALPETPQARATRLESEIASLEKEILILEPKVIAAQNAIDRATHNQSQNLKDQLFVLEKKKARLELELLSLE